MKPRSHGRTTPSTAAHSRLAPIREFGRAHVQPGPGRPLPSGVREKMEGAFKTDFSAVRIFEGEHPLHLGAAAYTKGQEIHFAPRLFRPFTSAGQKLLGHELTHVVQQSHRLVDGSPHINKEPGLENEASQLGARAARGQTAEVLGAGLAGKAGGTPPAASQTVQMMKLDELPEDMKLHAMSFVGPRTLHRLPLVNHAFRQLAKDNDFNLWRQQADRQNIEINRSEWEKNSSYLKKRKREISGVTDQELLFPSLNYSKAGRKEAKRRRSFD